MAGRLVLLVVGAALALSATIYAVIPYPAHSPAWTAEELATLRSLWLGSLPPLPPDPSNAVADDARAVALGHKLFFDARLSVNGQVACASCHQPQQLFTDGFPQALGVSEGTRNTPTAVASAYDRWFLWDGGADSEWAQALDPFEGATEHGSTRTQIVHLVSAFYRSEYEALFGSMPDLSDRARFPETAGPKAEGPARAAWDRMAAADREAVTRAFVNVGKAIAAYERRILPGPSRFDAYVEAVLKGEAQAAQAALTQTEVAGLRLFVGKVHCVGCHAGPLFSDGRFHNVAAPLAPGVAPDNGRAGGAAAVLASEFNCAGRYADARLSTCDALQKEATDEQTQAGAFKTPMLRDVAQTAPYKHAGQLRTLHDVVDLYNRAPAAPVGESRMRPLGLTAAEKAQLVAFLRSLSGPLATPAELLAPPGR